MKLKCNYCQAKFNAGQRVTIQIKKGKTFYKSKSGDDIKCPKCKSKNLSSVRVQGAGYGNFMPFSSKSLEEKSKFFRQRAKKHAASKSEVEKRKHINKQIDRNLWGRAQNEN